MDYIDYQEILSSISFQREIELQELRENFKRNINTINYEIKSRFAAAIAKIYSDEAGQEQSTKDYFQAKLDKLIENKATEEEIQSYLSSSRGEVIIMLLNNREEAHNRSLYFMGHELLHYQETSDSDDGTSDSDEDFAENGAFIVLPSDQGNMLHQALNATGAASGSDEATAEAILTTQLSGEKSLMVEEASL